MSRRLTIARLASRAADALLWPCTAYYATALVVLTSALFAQDFILPRRTLSPQERGILAGFLKWDGAEYVGIARGGYRYAERPGAWNAAFFPAYPLGGRWLARLTGMSEGAALLVLGHLALLGAFVLLDRYCHFGAAGQDTCRGSFALLAFALWPTTIFFRMAYSESLFLLTAIGAMVLMQRRCHPLWVALVVGLATATRPVGVALLGPLALYLWERTAASGIPRCAQNDRHGQKDTSALTPALSQRERGSGLWSFLRCAAVWLPLACWGIGGFMVFQYIEFGDPLAWANAHQLWSRRSTAPYLEQWTAALTLEPIWAVYDPSSLAYWGRHTDAPASPLFNLPFANPIYFVVAAFLVWLGWHKRWLNGKEVLLAALLLGIPYFTHGYRHLMLSQGRFAAVAFPVYLVLGRLLARMPPALAGLLCALAGLVLAVYAALFAAGYRVT